MQGKSESVISGASTYSFTKSRQATTLDYNYVLLWIENRGPGSGVVYSVEAKVSQDDAGVSWHVLNSGTVLYSGDYRIHKIENDPWDVVRFKTLTYKSGYDPVVRGYINRK